MREYLIRQPDETDQEWKQRKLNTPIPAVAKGAVEDVIRAINQRLPDVTRHGGSAHYKAAVAGEGSGIDREGLSMNEFIGQSVLPELLVMGRVGIFVDNIAPDGPTLADGASQPYAYVYRVEDIVNWDMMRPEKQGTFSMVLLRDHEVSFNQAFGISFPSQHKERLRLVWIGEDGFMRYRFFNKSMAPMPAIISNGQLVDEGDGVVRTQLREIPFVMPTINDSLLSDAAPYQRALMNIASNEAMFAINVNSPLLLIQKDTRADALQWKKPPGGSEEPGGQRSRNPEVRQGVRAGWVRGRYYDTEEDAPSWLTLPAESLQGSSDYRKQLADEVRQLVNVAVQNQTGVRSESRESRELSAQGLESGLHFIAMKMQGAERSIARFVSMYEGNEKDVAVITYPKRFSLKTQNERLKDALAFKEIIDALPTQEAKKEGVKKIVLDLYTGVVSSAVMDKILTAIDRHPYIGDFDAVMAMIEAGLITRETAGGSFDLSPEEVKKATDEKAEMAASIIEAQSARQSPDRPAARGVPEIDPNPQSGEEERAEDENKRGEQVAPTQEEEE